MEEFYRYIEPNGKHYKYVTASNREQALDMLSFLIDEDGYGSTEETYLFLREFEKIESYEVPENAHVLYVSKKNRICVSGTSEGPSYYSGTNIGWTQETYQLKPYFLFYVLPFKIFVLANSKEAAFAKLFPLESAIKRKERIQENKSHYYKYFNIRKINGSRVGIYPFMESETKNCADIKSLLPPYVTLLTEPTLEYDRWSNFITGFLFRRKGHQERFTEQQFNQAIKEGLLSTSDLICDEIPDIDMLCSYQSKNSIVFASLFPPHNICKTRSLAVFLESMESGIDFMYNNGKLIGVLTSTGEILEIEDETAVCIMNNNVGSLTEFEVYDMKKSFKYVRVIKRVFLDDLPF